jgi:hypothetical protein
MFVELDVFSGRPNPRWELDEERSEELRRLEARLAPARQAAPEPPGLGYRGFVYAGADGQVRAYRGYVKTPQAVLADPSFTVEHYLRNLLPPEYAELRQWLAGELKPK